MKVTREKEGFELEKLDLKLGDKLRMTGYDSRFNWIVKAVSENFAVVTRQAEFEKKGTLCYSVIDWRNGVRGPCNAIGQGFGDGTYSQEQCELMLTGFEYKVEEDPNYLAAMAAGEKSWPSPAYHFEVSHRNQVRLGIISVNGVSTNTNREKEDS